MARVLLFCVLLVAGASLPAQRIYLPVKVKHKWTFVAYLDTAIIDLSRQFDYISDINLPWFGQPGTSSGYYHIENNGKLGLANANFEIALEPAWQEIHPISHQFFLVSDGYYTVIDSSNTDLFNGNRFEAVQLAEQGGHEFFLVKEKGKWGACRAGENRLALPPAYHEIGYLKAGKGLFKVKYDHLDTLGWYVVDWEGEKLPNLKRPQALTLAAGPKYILTQQKASYTNWSIRDLTGKEVMILDPWAEVLPLNSYLLGYKQKPGALLKVLVLEDEIRTVPEEFNYLEAVNDDLAFFRTQTHSGFILPNGDLLILGGPEISAAEPGKG
ncbi:MAG: hypothetical protein H6558_19395, partial [Lewinellaceae bacterium]|nr:hypothetical protein [Lewinellaceae bacterium]